MWTKCQFSQVKACLGILFPGNIFLLFEENVLFKLKGHTKKNIKRKINCLHYIWRHVVKYFLSVCHLSHQQKYKISINKCFLGTIWNKGLTKLKFKIQSLRLQTSFFFILYMKYFNFYMFRFSAFFLKSCVSWGQL